MQNFPVIIEPKMQKTYAPSAGPQHRRKLLKNIAAERREFSSSSGELRRATGKLFDFTPLTPLSPAERSLLKKYAKHEVGERMDSNAKIAWRLLNGTARFGGLLTKTSKKAPQRAAVLKLFSDNKAYKTEITETSPTGGRSAFTLGMGSRDLKGYLEEGGIDLLKLAKDAAKRKGSRIRVLDVGSATAKQLAELGEKMGNQVETHAMSLDDEPHGKVGAYHLLLAEYMPKEFEGKYDVIVSHRALEYALFPHIALRNVAKALAPGGKAELQWRPGRTHFHGLPEMDAYFSTYSDAQPSEHTKAMLKENALQADHKSLSGRQVNQIIRNGIGKYGNDARQTVAWINEIAKLREQPGIILKIRSRVMSPLGWVPHFLIIEKAR